METLNDLESFLVEGNHDLRLLQTYHQRVVTLGQCHRGRKIYERILSVRPNDNQVRSLFVALCLQDNDYLPAMAAIETLAATATPDEGLIDAALAVRAKIASEALPPKKQGAASLSLCMIVKDESAGLGACLKGVKPLVDEMIIVDSGSTDRTLDIARLFGARTYAFKWSGDFSAARNFSLDRSSSDWILILDADEIIAPQDFDRIRNLIGEHPERKTAYSIETRNYTHLANAMGWQPNDGSYPRFEAGLGWFPSRKVRLFPRCDAIRFCYPVHELVEPSIKAFGVPILHCQVPIHHYGHLNETKNQRKAEQYFRMGYAKLDQLNEDSAAIRELAVQAGQLERWEEALELWQRLLRQRPDFAEALVNISSVYWQLGEYETALAYGCRAMEIDPEIKEARYNIAVSHLLLGRAAEAVAVLQDLLKTHRGYLAAGFMLAAAHGCTGDFQRSRPLLRALCQSPAGKAVPMAVQDLSQRLRRHGLTSYADRLERAASRQAETAVVR
jgi:glycosyltransferase involved in cell wall biosynthesis